MHRCPRQQRGAASRSPSGNQATAARHSTPLHPSGLLVPPSPSHADCRPRASCLSLLFDPLWIQAVRFSLPAK